MAHADPVYDLTFKRQYLHPKYWPTWLAIGLLWLLAWLPVSIRDRFAASFTPLLVKLAKKPCYIARTNIRLCFPKLSETEVEQLLHKSIRTGLMGFMGYGEWTARSQQYLQHRFVVHGQEHLDACLANDDKIIFAYKGGIRELGGKEPYYWDYDKYGYMNTDRIGFSIEQINNYFVVVSNKTIGTNYRGNWERVPFINNETYANNFMKIQKIDNANFYISGTEGLFIKASFE